MSPAATRSTYDADQYNWSSFICPYCSATSFIKCAGGHACDGTVEMRSGRPFRQCFCGHAGFVEGTIKTIEANHRSFQAVDVPTLHGARTTALDMIEDNAAAGSTVGGDKNYDTADFVTGCRQRGCTPHVSQNNTNRRSAIDARTTRHSGYRISTIKRKRIEECFGWIKTVGGLRKTRHRGRSLVQWFFVLTAAAYNLVRIPKLLAATG